MKIGILSSYFYHAISEIHGYDRIIFGGGERYLIELCKFLQSEGHEVSVYQPISIPQGVDRKAIPQQIKKEFKGVPITCMVGYKSNIYNVCPELNRDFNEIAGYFSVALYFTPFLAYPQAVKRSISICHGIYWDYSYGTYAAMTPSDQQEFMRRQLQGFAAADICIAVDSNVRRVIQAISPGAEKNIRVIPNFVDCEVFKPVPKTWEGIKVLYPRRLTMLRGSNEFIRTSQIHPEYQYLAVGQATHEETEQEARDWSANLPQIKFIHKEMDGMEEVYQGSDIAVVPTRACEGLSLSLLEAMACGLPVITTPVGGIGDAVIDRYNALVFDPNHDDLAEYIHVMAQDEEMRRVMGERNREIAKCFDIKIWQQRWKQIIDSFDSPQGIAERKRTKKLVAMMLVKNEANRYLRRVIENTLEFADEIAVLDDHSTDDSIEICEEYAPRVKVKSAENTWDDESELRKELFDFAASMNPDWLIAVDADEIFEPELRNHVQSMMATKEYYWYAFRFYDMWDDKYYRYDQHFKSGSVYAPRMFKYSPETGYEWSNKRRHCGSVPINMLSYRGSHCVYRVKHLGYADPIDRERKRIEKIADDPDFKFYPKETYDAIIDDNAPKVAWSDTNKWTAPGVTIAYPPDMEWGIMQQRPHHLLELAANEGNRIYFGDHTAKGIYEVIHNVTLINDWANLPDKNPDILYVTSPGQLRYCGDMNPKKVVYDCCDYRGGADEELIKSADHLFVASRELLKVARKLGRKDAVYLPNACDYDMFANENGPREDILCYMGIIASVLDFDLLNNLGADFRMCFVGQNKTLNKLPRQNVGHLPYEQLPGVLEQVKVGIIPFKLNGRYEQYSAPIKVYEYLAAGLPVVASPIPELKPLANMGLIKLVPTTDTKGWKRAVKKAFTEYPNLKGKEWAKGQTWKRRWEGMKGVLRIE